MVNKKWLLFVFFDKEKTDLWKVLDLNTIKDVGYIVNQSPQVVSNYYHNLIKERGLLKYCYLYQVSKNN